MGEMGTKIMELALTAALIIAGKAADLRTGAGLALEAIMNGKSAKTLAALVAISQGKSP